MSPRKPKAVKAPYVPPPSRARFKPEWSAGQVGGCWYVQAASVRPATVVREIAAGRYRIPPFQRDWCWTDEQIIALMDTLLRRMFCGTPLVWERYKLTPTTCQIGGLSVECRDPHAYMIVDGQQRLGAIYAVAMSGRFFFDLESGRFVVGDGPWRLPVGTALGVQGDTFYWLREHAAQYGLDEDRLVDCVGAASNMFQEMDFHCIVLDHRWTRANVVETFRRLNTMGTPMDLDELEAALVRAEEQP